MSLEKVNKRRQLMWYMGDVKHPYIGNCVIFRSDKLYIGQVISVYGDEFLIHYMDNTNTDYGIDDYLLCYHDGYDSYCTGEIVDYPKWTQTIPGSSVITTFRMIDGSRLPEYIQDLLIHFSGPS